MADYVQTMNDPPAKPVLERIGLHRPELRAWALYDWGNSAVMTTVIAAVFPAYFTAVSAGDLPRETALWVFGLVTSLAVIGIGVLSPMLAGLCVYVAITVLGYYLTNDTHFLILATLVGMVQGGTQALSRSLFAQLVPRHRSGECFGLYGVMDRFAGSGDTLAMAAVVGATGDPRMAILTVIVLFVVGGLILVRVDVDAGERTAREAERAAGVAHAADASSAFRAIVTRARPPWV